MKFRHEDNSLHGRRFLETAVNSQCTHRSGNEFHKKSLAHKEKSPIRSELLRKSLMNPNVVRIRRRAGLNQKSVALLDPAAALLTKFVDITSFDQRALIVYYGTASTRDKSGPKSRKPMKFVESMMPAMVSAMMPSRPSNCS